MSGTLLCCVCLLVKDVFLRSCLCVFVSLYGCVPVNQVSTTGPSLELYVVMSCLA